MKSDIPQLMRQRQLDAIVVHGNTDTSSDLAYLCGATLENVLLLWRADADPVLYVSPIEREAAVASGYEIRLWSDYPIVMYLRKYGNRMDAEVAMLSDILRDNEVSGRVGFYGMRNQGYAWAMLTAFAAANPQIEIVGEASPTLFDLARQTKDDAELDAMKRVGEQTAEVMASVVEYIQQHEVVAGGLVRSDGSPLTIGDIKAHIRLELAMRNLDEAHENIFAQGRDAGVPHNRGQWGMQLRTGEPIIFDIFPRDKQTGYYHDITRTWFLGYAPDDLLIRWQQIKAIYDQLLSEMRVGEPCAHYQHMTCDYFEELGYPTTRLDSKTQVGYNHSLGHGVGLDVHEAPGLNHLPDNDTILQPGHVVSVEPGLYDPEAGWGLRIEDTVAFDQSGRLVNLSSFPYDPIIALKNGA
ncbi:MAG: aminopeptidase P family protein [Caldilineales bacterium]|nr:aminopeptidase P family protein [Caldilineales bacterium]